jgi:hypothetical protein
VHVIVALADNAHQGIVPVSKALGDGQAPETNLYWGARYGVRSFFSLEPGWKKIALSSPPSDSRVLDHRLFSRVIAGRTVYLYAEAYDGRFIKDATELLLALSAGASDARTLGALPWPETPSVLAYIGHDGLMDFSLPAPPQRDDAPALDVYIFACFSRSYFAPLMPKNAKLIVATTGLMSPEAYSLDAALSARLQGKDPRAGAAEAYNTYQKCGGKGARRLFGLPP